VRDPSPLSSCSEPPYRQLCPLTATPSLLPPHRPRLTSPPALANHQDRQIPLASHSFVASSCFDFWPPSPSLNACTGQKLSQQKPRSPRVPIRRPGNYCFYASSSSYKPLFSLISISIVHLPTPPPLHHLFHSFGNRALLYNDDLTSDFRNSDFSSPVLFSNVSLQDYEQQHDSLKDQELTSGTPGLI
jgi:hypothetical protein